MKKSNLPWILFLLICTLELVAGYYVCHIKGFVFGDAISRVANAFYVLYIYPPHLASIGFVWNPLPSLMEIPLLLIWPIYKPIAASNLAGVILTSLFAAGSGVLIYRNALRMSLSKTVSTLLAFLYCFNPFIFIYGFSGLTEVPFSFMLLWLTFDFTQWIEDQKPVHLAKMAIALALAFLIRYETIPVSACAFMAMVIIELTIHQDNSTTPVHKNFRKTLEKIEGKSVVLLSPVIYVCLVWIFLNWMITGNPFYFLNSTYSNLGFSKSFADNSMLKDLIGNPTATLTFVCRLSHYFVIPLIVLIGYRIIKGRLLQWDATILVLLIGSTLVQQGYMLFKGISSGAFRYFVYPLVFITAWFPYEHRKMRSKVLIGTFLLSFLFADIYLGYAWFKVAAFRNIQEEVTDLHFNHQAPKEVAQREIAKYINTNIPTERILMDSFRTYNVILNVNHPEKIVTTCSYNFKAALNNPVKHRVEYILVPSYESDVNQQDAINIRYPNLYEKGASWCSLEKQFGDYYKLFRIHKKKERRTAAPLFPSLTE